MAINAVVKVDGENVDQALKLLKKKVEREGLVREIKKACLLRKAHRGKKKKNPQGKKKAAEARS